MHICQLYNPSSEHGCMMHTPVVVWRVKAVHVTVPSNLTQQHLVRAKRILPSIDKFCRHQPLQVVWIPNLILSTALFRGHRAVVYDHHQHGKCCTQGPHVP